MKFNNRSLPNRTYTNDIEVYTKTWNELADKVCSFFPGYVVAGYDPFIMLARRQINGDGTYTPLDHITIPLYAAMNMCCPKDCE